MTKARDSRGMSSLSKNAAFEAAWEGLERLEERVLLSGEALNEGGAWIRWGDNEVATLRGSYILTFDDYKGSAQAEVLAREAATRLGIEATDFRSIGRGGWAVFNTNDFISKDMAERVAGAMPGLKAIEPDQLRKTSRVSNDPGLSNQYGLINTGQFIPNLGFGTPGADIDAERAWDITVGSRDVVIAIIDTGIDLQHPDLIGNLWVNPGEVAGNGIDDDGNGFVDDVNGYDFGENDASPQDLDGHGTQSASAAGAVGNNGQGVAGVAWAVSLMGLKVADRNGNLSSNAIIAAHDYATMMRGRGINVVASNNSYGAYRPQFYNNQPQGVVAERDAIERWLNAGGVFVAAAGNGDPVTGQGIDLDGGTGSFPASYNLPGIISVAATDNNDGLADFSNFGAQSVDIAAPGVQIFMAQLGGGYGYSDGTSFSSPMVAGVVALLKSVRPSASAAQIRDVLINSAEQLPSLQGRVVSGGRVNALRALQQIGIDGPTLRSVDPGPVTTQLSPTTNTPINTLTLAFTKDIDQNLLSTGGITVVGDGLDNTFGTADDVAIPVVSVVRNSTNFKVVTAGLSLAGFPLQRLPLDSYRVTLNPANFKDTNGNFLNGNTVSGSPELYNFRVITASGDNEPNDTFAQATPVAFDASGTARFNGATIGNGLFTNLDVDLYRLDLPRGGLITAEITAQRRALPSTLDSYLRLFNSAGVEIARNDQFFGQDSFLDFFVSTGGTYYVGVSGFGNQNYNPRVAGSGSGQSLGQYDLKIDAQLVSNDTVAVNAGSGQVPLRIPRAESATSGVTTSFIDVTDSRQIVDVNVRFNIQHTFNSDLIISLISPSNREITLVNRVGGDSDNFTNTIIDDEGTTPINLGTAPYTGTFRINTTLPEASLGAYDGLNANGRWTLRIQDVKNLDAGNLISWGMDFTFANNIFGTFEFNDTITSARDLQEITSVGTGSAERQAFIGDGGFGNLDRDIFKFTAGAGTSLTVTLLSGGQLNSALRLFDTGGNQVVVSNPTTSNDSSIANFVLATGGTYYIAVSEASNLNYNPNTAGDGIAAATTGNYTLRVTLSSGVSDPALVLAGNQLSVGVNTFGTFGSGSAGQASTGIRFGGIDFFTSGGAIPQLFIGAVASGSGFTNTGPGGNNQLPFALVDRSDEDNRSVTATGSFRGLRIERALTFANSGSLIAVDVYLTNTGAATLTGVGWMEGFNPNPGLGTDGGLSTANDVIGRSVRATFTNNTFQQGLTIAMVAPELDTRAKPTVLGNTTVIRDPAQLINAPTVDPNGVSSDSQLAMSFNVGDLIAGATTRLRYFIMIGTSPAAVQSSVTALNDGSGTGLNTATVTNVSGQIQVSSASPALEQLEGGPGPTLTAPQLPYKLYYPEGFSGGGIYTSLKISNPNPQATRVIVIARFETGARDQILSDSIVAASSRASLEIMNPTTFANATALITRQNAPYAIEVRSERAVAATFDHTDTNLVGGNSKVGDPFTNRAGTTWTFPDIQRGNGSNDFIIFYNTTGSVNKVTITLTPRAGGAATQVTFNLGAFRRGGISIQDVAGLADGGYSAVLTADANIVAAISAYDRINRVSEGVVGTVGSGSTAGVLPEGQFGLNATQETIAVLNTGASAATVQFSFQFANGSSYRSQLAVPGGTSRTLDVGTLPNFPRGQAYAILYESNVAVSVTTNSLAFSDELWGAYSDRAYTVWGFGDGFRSASGTATTEYLRVYNPQLADNTIEITVNYEGGLGTETFRRTISSRRVAEFNVDQFITGSRRNVDARYSITIKGQNPVVSSIGRYDRVFGGAFTSLGTPSGISGIVNPSV